VKVSHLNLFGEVLGIHVKNRHLNKFLTPKFKTSYALRSIGDEINANALRKMQNQGVWARFCHRNKYRQEKL
jgi:hypothetical protein